VLPFQLQFRQTAHRSGFSGSALVRAFFLRPPNGRVDSIVFRLGLMRLWLNFFRLAGEECGVNPEKYLMAMVTDDMKVWVLRRFNRQRRWTIRPG